MRVAVVWIWKSRLFWVVALAEEFNYKCLNYNSAKYFV